jgi:hypothetical protein
MTEQITKANLEGVIKYLNKLTNSPAEPWTKTEEGFKANIGNYHLDGAYGGWELERMCSESGGVSDVLRTGHVSKRELYYAIHHFISGIEEGMKLK